MGLEAKATGKHTGVFMFPSVNINIHDTCFFPLCRPFCQYKIVEGTTMKFTRFRRPQYEY